MLSGLLRLESGSENSLLYLGEYATHASSLFHDLPHLDDRSRQWGWLSKGSEGRLTLPTYSITDSKEDVFLAF